jgi:hypothetical protein
MKKTLAIAGLVLGVLAAAVTFAALTDPFPSPGQVVSMKLVELAQRLGPPEVRARGRDVRWDRAGMVFSWRLDVSYVPVGEGRPAPRASKSLWLGNPQKHGVEIFEFGTAVL